MLLYLLLASAKQTKQLLPTPRPPIKKHPKSLGRGSVCHISTKIYTNSTDPSSVDQNTATNHSAQESIRPGEGWGPPESMAHHRCTPAWGGGSSSSCPRGSLLIQPTVQVHGNSHGCNLGVARCKSAPLNMQPPSPSQQGFGSQPSMPRAPGGGLDVPREEGSVSGAPWAPQAGPAPLQAQGEAAEQGSALTSKAAMPAATPPATPALVLISSRICLKQPCTRQPHG